jgi:Fe2+ transport system protein FeoA
MANTAPAPGPAPASAAPDLRLDAMAPGSTVVIDHIDGAVDGTVLRLMELGLVPGATVTVTRRAPFGDPLELAVLGTRLCLRKHDAHAFAVIAVAAVTP